MVIYFLAATAFFSILLTVSKKNKNFQTHPQFLYLTDFKYMQGLNIYFVAFFVFIFLIFAGLPPTVGFYLKFISSFFILQEYGILIVISISVIQLISAFLYLKVLKIMLFDNFANKKIIPVDAPTHTGNFIDQLVINSQIGLLIL